MISEDIQYSAHTSMLSHPFCILKAPPPIHCNCMESNQYVIENLSICITCTYKKENHMGLEWHKGKWANDNSIFTLGWAIPLTAQGGKSKRFFFVMWMEYTEGLWEYQSRLSLTPAASRFSYRRHICTKFGVKLYGSYSTRAICLLTGLSHLYSLQRPEPWALVIPFPEVLY